MKEQSEARSKRAPDSDEDDDEFLGRSAEKVDLANVDVSTNKGTP